MSSITEQNTDIIALLLSFEKWTQEESGVCVNRTTLTTKLRKKRYDMISPQYQLDHEN